MPLHEDPRPSGQGRRLTARFRLWGCLAALGFAAAACGGGSSGTPTTTAAPTGGGSTSPSGDASMVLVKSGTISGKTALVSATGFALYTYSLDKPGHIACTGGCVSSWPPLLVPKGDKLSMSLAGLGTEERPGNGGLQVTFKGSPLYTFSGNTKPGQNNGAGIPDWSLAASASSSGGSPTTSTSGGGW